MQRYSQIALYLFLISIISGWLDSSQIKAQNEVGNRECLETFETFAYASYPQNPRVIEPSSHSSWYKVASLPSQINQDFPIFNQVRVTRMTDDSEEVWITGNGVGFAVYDVNHQEWKLIPRTVFSTDYVVGQLFVANDGAIWGQNIPTGQHVNPEFQEIPLLSRFNETTTRFEIPADTMHGSVLPQRASSIPQFAGSTIPHILVDNDGLFWLIVSNDGIYKFDPVLETYERQSGLDFSVSQAALSTDGSLYLWSPNTQIPPSASFRERLTLPSDSIWHFSLEARSFALIDLPDRDWPIFNGMLVAQSGQLWLGAIGFRDLDHTWHLIHPNIDEYLDNAGNYKWGPPRLITESSDGRLWYVRDTDGAGEGTAWYDPQLGEGCLIMHHAANIVEDANQQLWMVANGHLYRHSLNSQ
ncbi:MAG TPA: hypothetical protein VHO69_19615 [Phototrophicaceae bacterium]|nr:hypothetical protein [Phototrophicaceae bacterium]